MRLWRTHEASSVLLRRQTRHSPHQTKRSRKRASKLLKSQEVEKQMVGFFQDAHQMENLLLMMVYYLAEFATEC
jgi:hypothetical protein